MLKPFRHWLLASVATLCVVVACEVPARAQSTAEPAGRSAIPSRLTVEQFDALIRAQKPADPPASPTDADFLRRASFDLIGRQPTLDEQRQFAADLSADKYRAAIERLLASEEFGVNWADYWCDTIAYRVPPPELTYLNYQPLKRWLTDKLNRGAPWDEVVRELLTASGKVADAPAATFVGYHQADATNLASETSRIFLGQQIGCAQCHDHPFDSWKRTQFHELAAFFARTRSKLSQNDGGGTVVSSADKGEYLLPSMDDPKKKGSPLQPAVLSGTLEPVGPGDVERRTQLAAWVTARENPWFALAYANRVAARLLGHGFYEPIDDLGESRPQVWPAVHQALAAHFVASGYDVKELFRLVASSQAYRQGLKVPLADESAAPAAPLRLRGDEIFAALRVGIELPDFRPEAVKPTAEVRFPPPPKSTRDLVNDAFGVDPSLSSGDAPRTIAQALWMMNNEQLQKQISARPGSNTMLCRLLDEQADDRQACAQLYQRVLARAATEAEVRIALDHVAKLGDRRAAFEDLLWGLVNSAEFSTRR